MPLPSLEMSLSVLKLSHSLNWDALGQVSESETGFVSERNWARVQLPMPPPKHPPLPGWCIAPHHQSRMLHHGCAGITKFLLRDIADCLGGKNGEIVLAIQSNFLLEFVLLHFWAW